MNVWVEAYKPPAMSHRQRGSGGAAIATGLVVGSLCYLLVQASTSSVVTSPGDHDLLITRRLGFILAPAVGFWVGWLQRSWRRALLGGGLGLAMAWIYFLVCSSSEARIGQFVVVSMLGGTFAAFCGSNRSDWLHGLGGRFAKGLVAGFLFGLAYTALISVGARAFWPGSGNVDYLGAHIRMMWRAGPVALGLAAAVLFPFVRWALDLGCSPKEA